MTDPKPLKDALEVAHFTPPFRVGRDAENIVEIFDAEGFRVASFNIVSRLPATETEAVEQETLNWVETAEELARWLNIGAGIEAEVLERAQKAKAAK